jgi:hypothetical protein
MNDLQITQVESIEVVEAKERASYDIQVTTAKRYPRDIERSKNNSIAIATMDKETAESCGYALPRGGKPVQGPSIHLAKIIAQNWGNLRCDAKIVDTTATQIVSQAVCWDLENNIAIKVEVRRKITSSNGKRFNEDMITMTGNAANAIALRNAIFAVVPEQVTKAAYNASRNMLAGDLTTEQKLVKSRTEALKYFADTHGVKEDEILKALGIGSVNGIKRDQIILLGNMKQALIDGDSTVNEMFNRKQPKKTGDQKKEELKNNQNTKKPEIP